MNTRCGLYVRVSTDEQRDNGYSIDSQLRMLKEHCEKNNYDIVDVYNDAGHSGKDLMRPEMQRLLTDMKSKKIDRLLAIKVDRITRNNYDGFWLLNYCEQCDVKIELILEPYDVSTANGEMMFGMNLVFGQRERKEIGARTKRAMEEMALEHIHPGQAPYGYIRNKETGYLEIEPIEALVVKEIFRLYKNGNSTRGIANIMKENNAYLKRGKWLEGRIHKILTNSIYIGVFEYGKYRRKKQDVLIINNYCEPIIDEQTWNLTRKIFDKNKHSNYGEFIHLFNGLIPCPNCGNILSSVESFKYSGTERRMIYYHLTCKNPNCKGKGLHYNSDKIEAKLSRVLNELNHYMFDMNNQIVVYNYKKTDEIKNIDKAINKLKIQEKKLVDLYINSSLDVETINQKNNMIKKELEKLENKKKILDPKDELKDCTIDIMKKLGAKEIEGNYYLKTNIIFSIIWENLPRETRKEIIKKTIELIEITRDDKYNIEIKNIKFTEEFISKNSNEYLKYLDNILRNSNIGIKYQARIDINDLEKYEKNYHVFSIKKYNSNAYSKEKMQEFDRLLKEHFYKDGAIDCPLTEEGIIIDELMLIPKDGETNDKC